MRVISMVPSWTETLFEAGVRVVGRTRFCVHPDIIRNTIPAIGGTKDWDITAVKRLAPDLVILDREGNPKWMAEQSDLPFISTHVASVRDLPKELHKLATALKNLSLEHTAREWQTLIDLPIAISIDNFPGVVEWGLKPSHPIRKILYVIWRNPWMVVSADTFIGSMLSQLGVGALLETYPTKYPEVDLENLPDKESTLLLFSTEPYPFLKKKNELLSLGFPYAIVDGESFSWFGIRSMRFLQSLLQRPNL